MALINDSAESNTYLSISLGKLRKKTDAENPNAVKRTSEKTGKDMYELVFAGLTGKIVGLEYKESKDYGNSLVVKVKDESDIYNVQISEESKYFSEFLTKYPNIDISKDIELKPYDFIPKGETSRKKGLVIVQNGEKLSNYYITKDGEKYIPKDGIPTYDLNEFDLDEWKIYNVRLRKFLKKQLLEKFIPNIVKSFMSTPELNEPVFEPEDNDDKLPF
jgi:hypothetical protein